MKEAVQVFKSFSNPTRLRILLLLRERDLCVCELAFVLGMEQSRVSHQLRVLRNAGLVEDRREGKWIIYRIAPEKKKRLRPVFRWFAEGNLSASEKVARDRGQLGSPGLRGIRAGPSRRKNGEIG